MNAIISIEQLAQELNGKLWVKGDLKRIYLNEGHNTNKMITKTFVYESDGNFIVSCHIECPSQSYNWIKSQEQKIIDNVCSKIENIIGNYSEEEKQTEELVFDEELEASLKCSPVDIVANQYYNPRLTPVKRVANLNNTELRDFYHGCGKYRVYVMDNQVVGLTRNLKDKLSNEPEGTKSYILVVSCGEICFNF